MDIDVEDRWLAIIQKELTLDDENISIDLANLPEEGVSEDIRVSPSYPGEF